MLCIFLHYLRDLMGASILYWTTVDCGELFEKFLSKLARVLSSLISLNLDEWKECLANIDVFVAFSNNFVDLLFILFEVENYVREITQCWEIRKSDKVAVIFACTESLFQNILADVFQDLVANYKVWLFLKCFRVTLLNLMKDSCTSDQHSIIVGGFHCSSTVFFA